MSLNKEFLKDIPGVDTMLLQEDIIKLVDNNNIELVKYCIRQSLNELRNSDIDKIPSFNTITSRVKKILKSITERSLKPVINATGIILHTNLGRSPFGDKIANDTIEILKTYNNLEFDLDKGERGSRNTHVSELLKYLTNAEDVLIVNNNAAAIMLVLRTFAKNKEVIVSRSELIEIGGSFRLPDIMAASDCKMIEVGTTNKTRANDYISKINNETSLLFKTHKSNYSIKGFTEEVDLKEMVGIGKSYDIPVVFDIGSGLLLKQKSNNLKNEPDIKTALSSGVDMICFSGDKLLGGPQAGIIVGKRKYIKQLKAEQMTRALRVGKTTLAFLEAACRSYLNEDSLYNDNVFFKTISKTKSDIKNTALLLQNELKGRGVESEMLNSKGKYGGGTLPDARIDSFSLRIVNEFASKRKKSEFFVKMYHALLQEEKPLVAILKKGELYFDVLTIFDNQIEEVAATIVKVFKEGLKN